MYTKNQVFGSSGKIYAEIVADTKPNPLPATTDDVPDIPNGYEFEPGSWLYCLDTWKRYEIASDGTWTEVPGTSNSSGGSSGGGGGGEPRPEDMATDEEVQEVIDNLWDDDTSGDDPSGGSSSSGTGEDEGGDSIASDDDVNNVIDDIWQNP